LCQSPQSNAGIRIREGASHDLQDRTRFAEHQVFEGAASQETRIAPIASGGPKGLAAFTRRDPVLDACLPELLVDAHAVFQADCEFQEADYV
jgi:hypothetical protein